MNTVVEVPCQYVFSCVSNERISVHTLIILCYYLSPLDDASEEEEEEEEKAALVDPKKGAKGIVFKPTSKKQTEVSDSKLKSFRLYDIMLHNYCSKSALRCYCYYC